MQRRRPQPRSRARTVSLPQTPKAAVTFFPKDLRAASADDDGAIGDLDTDPALARRHDTGPDLDALAYHRAKIEKLLRGDRRALEGLDAHALAEVAVFGHGLYEAGRLNEARVVFEGLVAMDPAEAFPYTVLGAIFLAQHDLHRALALFEAALELDGDDVAALVYRGEIRLRLGQRTRAVQDLKRALAIDPDGPEGAFSIRARSALSR